MTAFNPQTKPGRLLFLGIGFVNLVTIAAYTANLATYLSAKSIPEAAIGSLEDAMSLGDLCVRDYDGNWLKKTYPGINLVLFNSGNQLLKGYRSNKCVSMIVTAAASDKWLMEPKVGSST